MASKELELAIKIGGYLSQGLKSSLGAATKLFKDMGMSGEEAAKKLECIKNISVNEKKLKDQATKLKEACDKLSEAAKKEAEYSGQNAAMQARLSRRREEAQAKVAQLQKKTDELKRSNMEYKRSVEQLYGPIDKLIREESRLLAVSEKIKDAQKYQSKIEAGVKNRTNLLMGAEYRLRSARNIANLMRTPFEKAAEAQKIRFELSTVINTDDKNKAAALAKAQKSAEELAKAGYSSYAEAMQAQYALNSAGLTAELASAAVKTVASVAKVTKGELGQVGEILATAYNNLGGRLAGTAEEKFAAFGNILTKVQFKYQIRDFAQLGESMKYASVGISQYNVNLEQAAAAIGMLNTAGLQGGQAGTSFNSMLKGLYKVASDIPGVLVKDKNGTVDLAASLGRLQKGLSKMNEITRARFLTEKFGDEGAKAVIPLVAKTAELAAGYKEIGAAVKENIVDEKMTEYLSLTSVKLAAAREQAMFLGMKLGNVLLPRVTEIIECAGRFADKIGKWADAHPTLTRLIVGTAAFGVALNLAGAAIMYVGTGFYSIVTFGQKANLFMKVFRLAMSGASVAGLKYAKAASLAARAVGGLGKVFSLVFSPGGLIVLGIAAAVAGAYFLWKNWDTVKEKCIAIWTWMKDKWDAFCNAFPTGSAVIKGVVDGIVGYYKLLWDALKSVFDMGKKVWDILTGAASAPMPSASTVGGKTHKAGRSRGPMSRRAAGGLVSRPELALIGEAGPEMVVPLANKQLGFKRLGEAASMLGGLGGGISVSYSPHIVIQGGASRHDVAEALRSSKDELRRMIEEISRDSRRVSLA